MKASGKMEKFDERKLRRTVMRAGADKSLAEKVVKEVKKRTRDGTTTREILQTALNILDRDQPHIAAKYDLKGAIMRMGPAGYDFEKYFAAILKEHGYITRHHRMVQGGCVRHEIDVTAEKELRAEAFAKSIKHYMIELKYHSSRGIYTGLKEALYTYARFLDLLDGWKKGTCEKFDQPWLVCNTKFSDDALEYGNCKKMRLIGWNYPTDMGLERMIESNGLYPVTALRGVDERMLKQLSDGNVMLCKDLLRKSVKKLQETTGIPKVKLEDLIDQSRKLIGDGA